MKIKTEVLKEMVAKSVKAVGNNKLIPITNLIGINLSENIFSLYTTDGNNLLRVNTCIDDSCRNLLKNEDINITVDANVFVKLIGKLTTEFVEFELENSSLKIKADGEYKLEIPLDSDGKIITLNTIRPFDTGKLIDIKKLQADIKIAEVSVAQTMEVPALTGYYIGEKVITTDTKKVCYINNKDLDEPILITNNTAQLLQLFDNETTVSIQDKELLFSSSNITLYCKQLDGIDIYPVQSIENLLTTQYDGVVKVEKNNLLNVLDRMSIFASQYDGFAIVLDIISNGLKITSKNSNAYEILSTIDVVEKEFRCVVDVEMLKSEVESVTSNIIEIHYGSTTSLQIKDNNVILVLSLLTE